VHRRRRRGAPRRVSARAWQEMPAAADGTDGTSFAFRKAVAPVRGMGRRGRRRAKIPAGIGKVAVFVPVRNSGKQVAGRAAPPPLANGADALPARGRAAFSHHSASLGSR
jgi:hypothetical protein